MKNIETGNKETYYCRKCERTMNAFIRFEDEFKKSKIFCMTCLMDLIEENIPQLQEVKNETK